MAPDLSVAYIRRMAHPKALRAGIYARLSLTTEESVSIERQLSSCRRYAEQKGYTVVAEASDDSVSATRYAPEQRAGFRTLLAQASALDVVIVWKVDRLARRTLDFLQTYQRLQVDGCSLAAVDDPLDLTTPQGKAFASILSIFAELEAATISARVRAAREYILRDGRAMGRHPWQFRSVPLLDAAGNRRGKRWELVPERADALREAAFGIMAGAESFHSIRRAWDARPDLPAPQGGKWAVSTIRNLLRSPALYGAVIHRGEVMRDEDGLPVVEPDRAVLNFAEWSALQAELTARTREPVRRGLPALLNGVLFCYSCGRAVQQNRPRNVRGRYSCTTPDCGGVSTDMEYTDEAVTQMYLDEFGDRPVFRFSADESAGAAEQARLREAIHEMTRRLTLAEDETEVLTAHRQRAELQRRLAEATQTHSRVRVLRDTGQTRREQWEELDVFGRNRVLRDTYVVTVHPGRRGRHFDPDRLEYSLIDTLTA